MDYEVLECPPADQFDHSFWQDILRLNGMLQARIGTPSKGLGNLTHREAGVFLRVAERPEREMLFLHDLFAESLRRDEEGQRVPEDHDHRRPVPMFFGLRSFRPDEDLVRRLLAFEDELSPGPLRDIVHLTALCRTLYDSDDEGEQFRAVRELLPWLDTLHEVERHCLAMRIISWASMMGPDEPAFYELVLGAAKRLPEQLYEFEDYRGYRLREYAGSHPPFREYREGREEFPQKETPPAGIAAPEPPDGPGAEPTTNPFGEP